MKPVFRAMPFVLAAFPHTAMAQPVAPSVNLPMQDGSLIIDQNRIDRQAPAQPVILPPPAARGDVRAVPDSVESGAKLARVRVEGSNAPMAVLQEAFAPFIGRTLDKATIGKIASALSDAYGKGDVALYTIVVPQQDLSDGVLTLRVVEGYIDDVVITGDVKGRDLDLVRRYAARLAAEKPLRRPMLERYLSLIRDIPGLEAEVQLLNLQTAGAVRLVLTLKHDDLDFGLVVNNRGIANLGRTQVQANATANSLFRQGDQTRLTVSLPTDVERFQYYALSHSTPIGAEGMRLGANIGYLRTRPKNIPVRGEATSAGLTLSYPVKRSYEENIYLSLGLDGINSDQALFGQLIASNHTRAVRGSASWSKADARRALSAMLTVSRGLDILDAEADPLLTELASTKLNGRFGANYLIGQELAVRLSGTGQLSGDRLPASEQFTLGGDSIGRAFPSGYVVGDKGYGLSAELAWAGAKPWPAGLKGSELYVFADGGEVWTASRFFGLLPRQNYDLASAGGGVRLNFKGKTIVGLEAARTLTLPYAGTTRDWRFIISWRSLH